MLGPLGHYGWQRHSEEMGIRLVGTSMLRKLNTELVTYSATYGRGFPDRLDRCSPPRAGQPDIDHADLLDKDLFDPSKGATTNSFVKDGYRFTYTPGPDRFGEITSYTISARPLPYARSVSVLSYYTDESAVIRATPDDRAATRDDPPR